MAGSSPRVAEGAANGGMSGGAEPGAAAGRGVRERLARLLDEAREEQGLPLVACAAFDSEGAVVLGSPSEAATLLFPLASITKVVTALSAHALAERGRLSLDAPVGDELARLGERPRFHDERLRAAPVRWLLSHTSGLPDTGAWASAACTEEDGALRERALSVPSLGLASPPGERFHYSNDGFDLLGHLVSLAHEAPFEEAARALVLEPLGMRRATFFPLREEVAARATPHLGGPSRAVPLERPWYSRAHAPSGTLWATIDDLCALARSFVVRPGEGPRALSQAALLSMRAAVVPTGRLDGSWSAEGLFVRRHRGAVTMGHGGWDPGARAGFSVIDERGVGAVVLMTHHFGAARELVAGALDALLGHAPEAPFGHVEHTKRAAAGRYERAPSAPRDAPRDDSTHGPTYDSTDDSSDEAGVAPPSTLLVELDAQGAWVRPTSSRVDFPRARLVPLRPGALVACPSSELAVTLDVAAGELVLGPSPPHRGRAHRYVRA
jgi:CubicO group peptidase (beta-lactamase class C family)